MHQVSDDHADTKRFNLLIAIQPDGIGWRYAVHCASCPHNTFSVYDAWMKCYVVDVWYESVTEAVDAAIAAINSVDLSV